MLTLSEDQWRQLQAHDARQFVETVASRFLSKRPEMLQYPGRETVVGRMQAANDYARRIGFTSTPHIVRLMYLYVDAPRIHEDRAFDAYLRKPGATPEERFDEVLDVMNNELERIDR